MCKCGCGQQVKWSAGLKSFRKYIHGHQSRVHNNWGHNPKAIRNSSETRRKQFASGERIIWCKGRTVSTDLSLQAAAKKLSARFTDKIRKEYSERMKKMRLNGTCPTLRGKDHSQWAGGVSSIKSIAHCSPRLFQEWRYPIFVRDGFKCVQCSSTDRLQIHHDKESMSEIVKKFVSVDTPEDFPFEKKKELADKIVDYHIVNKVSGKTLCHKCHSKIHPSLNFC